MAKKTVPLKIIGVILVIIGSCLVYWGYQQSGSIESGVTKAITGSDTNQVLAFYLFGMFDIFVGIYLYLKK